MDWTELIGKKVAALRGFVHRSFRHHGRQIPAKETTLDFVLFDDGETFLRLTEQDYHDFHDCSHSARDLDLVKDVKQWKAMMDKEGYDEPKRAYPF